MIELLLEAVAGGTTTIQLDVTGVTRARTVARELFQVINRHLEAHDVDIVIEGSLV